MKGSIPPANRRRRAASSMRAATASGYVFVGPPMGRGSGNASVSSSRLSAREPEYKAQVILPNPEVQQARRAFQEALGEKRAFWQEEAEQWLKEFEIPESLVEFLANLGIDIPTH